MRDDEVSIVDVHIHRRARHPDSRQSADHEHRDERQRVHHRRRVMDVALVERAEPVESLNRRRHPDDHRRDHETAAEHRIHPRHEHVMAPHDPRQERDRGHRIRHRAVSEYRLARKRGDDVGGDPHRGQDHDVNLGMAEKPEQMLPQQRLAATRGRKKWVPPRRSNSSSASAVVSTGSASSSRIAVMKSDQITSGRRKKYIPLVRMLMIVVMYLIEPISDDAPSTMMLMHHKFWPQSTPV